MKFTTVAVAGFFAFSLSWLIAGAIYDTGYKAGVDSVVVQVQQQQITHDAEYRRELKQAIKTSQEAATSNADKQRELNTQIMQLQEQLNDALSTQPVCVFTDRWVRHYSAALGLPAAATAPDHPAGTADTSRPAADAATLLQHAQQYGHWCRSELIKLTSLQQLLRGRGEL